MTYVTTISELYKLIPETKSLEGVNFSNLKELLTSVIKLVEKTGKWEFVQYLSGQPSIFIVREKLQQASLEDLREIISEEISSQNKWEPSNADTESIIPKKSKSSNKSKNIKEVPDKYEENYVKTLKSTSEKLFDDTKMPW